MAPPDSRVERGQLVHRAELEAQAQRVERGTTGARAPQVNWHVPINSMFLASKVL